MGLQQTEPLTINLMYLILILLWLDSDKAFLETTTVFVLWASVLPVRVTGDRLPSCQECNPPSSGGSSLVNPTCIVVARN